MSDVIKSTHKDTDARKSFIIALLSVSMFAVIMIAINEYFFSTKDHINQVLLAPDHVCDVHQAVIDDHGEVVRGEAIALLDNEVPELDRVERNPAPDEVVHEEPPFLGSEFKEEITETLERTQGDVIEHDPISA